jgi:hypothetical protein
MRWAQVGQNKSTERRKLTGSDQKMNRVKWLLAKIGLAGTTIVLTGTAVFLQLTVHDPHHVLLTALGTWGILSLPIGLLVGHFALSED